MNCDGFGRLLDAYIDGELHEEELRQFMDHAQNCENCRIALREAEMLRDLMKDMDDDVAVPLEAQAAWRGAVRAEAKKLKLRRAMKFAYAAAAALIVLVGTTVAFNAVNEKGADTAQMQPMMMRAAGTEAETEELIARDGDTAAASADYSQAYTAMKKISAGNYDEACMTVELLCQEYTGTFTAEAAAEGEKNAVSYRIELPYEYMADFLNAASRIGDEIESEIDEAKQQTAVVLIQIIER